MGNASIIIVLGFALALGIILPSAYRNSNQASDNYLDYLKTTQAHNIAVSAANMAADSVFWNKAWRTGYSNVTFGGGKYSVTLADTTATVSGAPVTWVKLKSSGSYQGISQNVEIILAPGNFAQFAYYSNTEGSINWVTGDTVWGRFHTQDKMTISGSPVFMGKVTNQLGTNPKKSSAKFNGSYQSGVSIPMPGDLSGTTTAAAAGGKVYSAGDLWLTIKDDSLLWKTSATGTVTRTTIAAYAPNRVINVSAGNVHVQGTLDGILTICSSSTASGKGMIYIDDDVLLKDKSLSSNDILGLVAEDNVVVTDNTANGTNCEIDAAIFSLTGGLTAENYNRSSPTTPPVKRGTLTVFGGITQYQRGPVGTLSGSTLATGFFKNYRFDDRLATTYPPYYPLTGTYQVISWLE